MGLFRRESRTKKGLFFVLFQRVLYRHLGVVEIGYEPYYTLAWVVVVSLSVYLGVLMFERVTWGRALGLAGVITAIAILVVVAVRFGIRPVSSIDETVDLFLRLRLGKRERDLLHNRGVNSEHPGELGRFIEALWEREWAVPPHAGDE